MNNIMDYLHWRGDISFDEVGLTDADCAVLGCMSYFPFDGLIPERMDESVKLVDALVKLTELAGKDGDGRLYHMKDDAETAQMLIRSPRFAELYITGFVNKIDYKKEEQFAAMTLILPGNARLVLFRGTDKTIVGWKEDFNLSFSSHVPAQKDSVKYLERAAAGSEGPLYVLGHSKGGNLAMYSSVYCSDEVQSRIARVINLDGPGFEPQIIEGERYKAVVDRIMTFIPQSSVVGMLMEHAETHTIIHSNATLLQQHNIYTWEIARGGFVDYDGLTGGSIAFDKGMKDWVKQMTVEERSKTIDGIYSVVVGAGIVNTRDFFDGRKVMAIMRAFSAMDDETRALVSTAYKSFSNSMRKAIPIKLLEGNTELAKLLKK